MIRNGNAAKLWTAARMVTGVLATAVAALAALAFAAALANPWRLVALDRYFGDPFLGLVVVGLAAYVALRLLLPVRNEAVQRVRLRVRAIPLVAAGLGFLLWGVFGVFLNSWGEYEELARSGDGERAVGLVAYDRDDRQLHVWEGDGLTMRRTGEIGKACGLQIHAEFVDANLVEIDTGYGGPWRIELDADTGEPLARLGPRCSDGPQPN